MLELALILAFILIQALIKHSEEVERKQKSQFQELVRGHSALISNPAAASTAGSPEMWLDFGEEFEHQSNSERRRWNSYDESSPWSSGGPAQMFAVNPATGLPIASGDAFGPDVLGNAYGTSSATDLHFGSDADFGASCDSGWPDFGCSGFDSSWSDFGSSSFGTFD